MVSFFYFRKPFSPNSFGHPPPPLTNPTPNYSLIHAQTHAPAQVVLSLSRFSSSPSRRPFFFFSLSPSHLSLGLTPHFRFPENLLDLSS
jgi:hypothetical protein